MKDWEKEFGDRYPIVSNDVRFPNGSILMFRHGDDLNALKNVNLGGALMVQAEEMQEEDFWFLSGRLRRKEGTRQLRLECNYDGHNYIYKLFDEQKIGTLITTNTFDNEANLPADYIPKLKLLPKRLQERHLYGSDADMEGAVWDEFSRAKNIVDPFYIPANWDKFMALDHGFTNPTAIVWLATDWDGNIFCFDEHYEAGKVVSYHADQIKLRKYEDVSGYADPSIFSKTQNRGDELHSIADEYHNYGISLRPADNTLLSGINKVNEMFKTGKIKIFKNCVNTIREVENWKWRKLKPGVYKNEPDAPMDKDDHACDALRYGVMAIIRPSDLKLEEKINPQSAWGQHLQSQRKSEDFIYARPRVA
jgi:PBSX family phage terminase large subunit